MGLPFFCVWRVPRQELASGVLGIGCQAAEKRHPAETRCRFSGIAA